MNSAIRIPQSEIEMFSQSRLIQLVAVVGAVAVLSAFYFGARIEVFVQDGDQSRRVLTRAQTVGDVLGEVGIALRPEDIVSPPRNAALEPGTDVTISRATPVRITLGSQLQTTFTHGPSIAAILAGAGLTLGPEDVVYADGTPLSAAQIDAALPELPRELRIARAVPILIIDGDTRLPVSSAAATVGQALWDAGVRVRLADTVAPPLDTPLAPDLEISVQRAEELLVQVDGKILPVRSQHARVGDLLADLGVTLTGADYAIPGVAEAVPEQGEVRVVRVLEQRLTENAPAAFETVSQPVPELELDQTTLVQEGSSGILSRRVRVRYEDGVEVSRETEGEFMRIAPQPRIVGYGTNIVVRTIDAPTGPVEYWRAVDMYATSYSPSRSGTSPDAPWYGLTRSGKPLKRGMVAIDLNIMPLGTPLYIPGYGYATAEDTGGGVRGRLIDLGFEDENYESWHQTVTVYFLTPVPPADQITWILP